MIDRTLAIAVETCGRSVRVARGRECHPGAPRDTPFLGEPDRPGEKYPPRGRWIAHRRAPGDSIARNRSLGFPRAAGCWRASPEMGLTAFSGRCLFAVLFLASAVNKFNSLAEGDAELMDMVSPRLRVAKAAFAAKTGMDPFLLIGDRQLVTLATAIEFTGAALFVADFALGAKMLMLFILVVTPVMHPYWSHEPGSAEASVDMIMFFKNVSLFGALLFYGAMQPAQVAVRVKRD